MCREDVAQLRQSWVKGWGGTRKGVGILGRGKRGPGTGPLLREERGERTWRASGASDAASLWLAARQAGSLPPCRHGDPGPLSLQTPCPPALRPESALALPWERRQGGSRRGERTGSPGAWGGGCRISRERGAAPHTPPGDRPYPLSVSLRAPASGRAGLGVIGFPSCVWEIRF